jgi:uncharacterized protein YifN (PemK superfamily)
MNTFIVRYFEEVTDKTTGAVNKNQLGQASYDGIVELLLPNKSRYEHLYLTIQFLGNGTQRWRVESVLIDSGSTNTPAVCNINLKKRNGPVETYLNTTLSGGGKIGSLLQFGTMVEVDYGFIPAIAKHGSDLLLSNTSTDALLSGELHKRRLAFVVRASKETVQVIPVTSNAPDAGDKTCFEIDPDSLKNLSRYSTSGKRSWALCGMVDSVSPSRILPPETVSPRGGTGRLASYPERLPKHERVFMRGSLAHLAGITNFEVLRDAYMELKEIQLREKRKRKAAPVVETEQEIARMTALQEVASDLAKNAKVDLEQLVQEQMSCNVEMVAELAEQGLP